MFHPLKELFAIVLAGCEPSDPKQIFEDLKNTFVADILEQVLVAATAR